MTFLIVIVAVLASSATSGGLPVPPGSEGSTPSDHVTVEQRWPDGSLRERRTVLVLPDGTMVDDGPFERWYIDGTKEYETVFVLGKKEGTSIRYHRNGRVASRDAYHDGKRDGPSVSWNDTGEKVKEENWSDGKPHGTWTVWEDGSVVWTHIFDHGNPDP